MEVDLRLAAAMIDDGSLAEAEAQLAEVEANDPWEWRAGWYRGIAALAVGGPTTPGRASRRVPRGARRACPKLALGLACESAGRSAAPGAGTRSSRDRPLDHQRVVGLARCRLQDGDRAGTLAAYERVPDTSSGYIDAQTARIRCLAATARAGPGSRSCSRPGPRSRRCRGGEQGGSD